MSKTRLISALTASVAVLVAACWLVTGTFPLMAAPQVVNDAPGVTVGLSGTSLLHRSPVEYPAAALRAGIQGTLSVEVKLDAKGNVFDARVLSGPDELRKAALQSVLQWHFASDSAGATRVVQIAFELPKTPEMQPAATQSVTVTAGVLGVVGGVVGGVPAGVAGGVVGGIIGSVPAGSPPPAPPAAQQELIARAQQAVMTWVPRTIKNITILGLSDQARNELLSKLPVHEGDTFSAEAFQNISQAARDFDEHLSVRTQSADGGVSIQILAPGAEPPAPQRIKVGGNVQAAMVLTRVQPVYPDLAKTMRVEGVVHLAVIIAKDGTIQEIHSLGGPAVLITAAMDAVKQWVYRTTLLNGQPVQVETTVDINFTLNQ
jgi:TonB family protein